MKAAVRRRYATLPFAQLEHMRTDGTAIGGTRGLRDDRAMLRATEARATIHRLRDADPHEFATRFAMGGALFFYAEEGSLSLGVGRCWDFGRAGAASISRMGVGGSGGAPAARQRVFRLSRTFMKLM